MEGMTDPADTGIEELPVPKVCQAETQTAAKNLNDLVTELGKNLAFENWLKSETAECCQDLGLDYVKQRREKEEKLATLTTNVAALVGSIGALGGRDLQMLRDDFTAESQAGTVTPMLDTTVVADTPDDC